MLEKLPNLKQFSEAQKDSLIQALWEQAQLLKAEVRELKERVKQLEGQIAKNSGNSSKPPSSDGFKKPVPKSLRGKSGKRAGGQLGHPGSRLECRAKPNERIFHRVKACRYCHLSLSDVESSEEERRQVFDIPSMEIKVVEHIIEKKICPRCRRKNKSHFPENVEQPTQYGPGIKSLITYLNQYQLLPYNRLSEFFEDVFGHHLSQGTLVKTVKQCFSRLSMVEKTIKQLLQSAECLHSDETSLRVMKKLYWCHVASTTYLTSYGVHAKRGTEAIEAMDILPAYKGTLIHDHFSPYFRLDCHHGLCNAHHLRELVFIAEQCKQPWANHMIDLLLAIKKHVALHSEQSLTFSQSRLMAYERCYDEIVMQGIWHPDNIPKSVSRKSAFNSQTKAKNLLDRLRFDKAYVLAFMYNLKIPFDNNQAERDIRMLKVKQKISGCFRSFEGAQWLCRIRSYLSTARKQGQNALDVLQLAFNNTPFVPQTL